MVEINFFCHDKFIFDLNCHFKKAIVQLKDAVSKEMSRASLIVAAWHAPLFLKVDWG